MWPFHCMRCFDCYALHSWIDNGKLFQFGKWSKLHKYCVKCVQIWQPKDSDVVFWKLQRQFAKLSTKPLDGQHCRSSAVDSVRCASLLSSTGTELYRSRIINWRVGFKFPPSMLTLLVFVLTFSARRIAGEKNNTVHQWLRSICDAEGKPSSVCVCDPATPRRTHFQDVF